MTALEQAVEAYVAPFHNARHLIRARDWLVVLDPEAGEGGRIAALLHDVERNVPGGPAYMPEHMPPHDEEYLREHAARSADLAAAWLAAHGASPELVAEVRHLILEHEWGGDAGQDLIQAADSLSFLEVNGEDVVRKWLDQERCDRERGIAQLVHMRDRIRLDAARPLADALLERAVAAL